MRNTSAPILARRWGVYAQPKSNEERVILALERAFPGSTWIESGEASTGLSPQPRERTTGTAASAAPPVGPSKDQPLPASTAPNTGSGPSTSGERHDPLSGGAGAVLSHRLSMLSVLDQALAFGAHGDAGKTPPVPPDRLYDYAVIGAQNFDAKEVDRWLSSLPVETSIITGSGKGSEQHVIDSAPRWMPMGAKELPVRKDHFGAKALSCQIEDVLNRGKTIVIIGKGSRPDAARSWLKRFHEKHRPPVIEIGVK